MSRIYLIFILAAILSACQVSGTVSVGAPKDGETPANGSLEKVVDAINTGTYVWSKKVENLYLKDKFGTCYMVTLSDFGSARTVSATTISKTDKPCWGSSPDKEEPDSKK